MDSGSLVLSLIKSGLARRYTGRSDNYIHASDLPRWCSRRYVLCQKLKRPFHHNKYIPPNVSLTFSIGEQIEEIITRMLHESGEVDMTIKGIYLEDVNKDITLTGSIDIGVIISNSFLPIEVKSIAPDGFDELVEPKVEHRLQLMTYLHILRKKKVIKGFVYPSYKEVEINLRDYKFHNNPQGVIVYVCKTQKIEPIKTFSLDYDHMYKRYIENIFKEIRSGKKKLPPKVCIHQGTSMARECPEVNFCFEEQ